MERRVTRRWCLKSAVAAGTFSILPSGLARGYAANEKLNLGIIGAGGRGAANTKGLASENIVALCDVDRNRLDAAARKFPEARTYADFRELLAQEKQLDAAVVSTPDHCHAPVSVMAMKQGLDVYCEKPLTHNIHEARVMTQLAAETGAITHMGTTAQSSEDSIRTVEAIRDGCIGDIVEAHCWTNRPIWAQGFDRLPGEDEVPDHLDWDLWIGPAPMRPYRAQWPEGHPALQKWPNHPQCYHPFVWRGWWDFGTGAVGDIAPHTMNVVFWALELGSPTSVEVVETSGMMPEMFPDWSVIRYDFPARGKQPPVKLFWYDGNKLPPAELLDGARGGGSSLFVGTRGKLCTGGLPYPEKDFADYTFPEPSLPRRKEIHVEWIECVKNRTQPGCPFGYSGPMTEAYLLGNIALRVGQRIEWDAAAMRITNCQKANDYVRREYREGWEL